MAETLRSLWSPTEPHGASKEPYVRDPREPCIRRRPTGPQDVAFHPSCGLTYTELMVLGRRVQNVSG